MSITHLNNNSSASFNGKQSFNHKQKLKRFCQKYNLNQEVQGIVLKIIDVNFVWLEVEQIILSANLPFIPKPGQILLLRIESFYPEIVLKFLKTLSHSSTQDLQLEYLLCRDTLNKILTNNQGNSSNNTPANITRNNLLNCLHSFFPFESNIQQQSKDFFYVSGVFTSNFISHYEQIAENNYALWKKTKETKDNKDSLILKQALDNLETAKSKVKAYLPEQVIYFNFIPWLAMQTKNSEIAIVEESKDKLWRIILTADFQNIGRILLAGLLAENELIIKTYAEHPEKITIRINSTSKDRLDQHDFTIPDYFYDLPLAGLGKVLSLLLNEHSKQETKKKLSKIETILTQKLKITYLGVNPALPYSMDLLNLLLQGNFNITV